MIFLTVGTQLPFERLVQMVDEVAVEVESEFISQVGDSSYQPENLRSFPYLNSQKFNEFFQDSELVISHAGIGSILSARKFGKPILVCPRRADLNEHRNDHQLATAEQLGNARGVYIFHTLDELRALLKRRANLDAPTQENSSDLHRLRGFLESEISRVLGR